jgi:hypothetical protein
VGDVTVVQQRLRLSPTEGVLTYATGTPEADDHGRFSTELLVTLRPGKRPRPQSASASASGARGPGGSRVQRRGT